MAQIKEYRIKLEQTGTLEVCEPIVSGYDQARRIVETYYRERMPVHEEVIALMLNGQNQFIGLSRLAEGGLHGCALLPRDIAHVVFAFPTSSFILAHNHPSGNSSPSYEDVEMANEVRKSFKKMGVSLLDALVFAHGAETQSIAEIAGW